MSIGLKEVKGIVGGEYPNALRTDEKVFLMAAVLVAKGAKLIEGHLNDRQPPTMLKLFGGAVLGVAADHLEYLVDMSLDR